MTRESIDPVVVLFVAVFATLPLQVVEERVILGTDVICRDQPSSSAAAVGSLSVRDAVRVHGRSDDADSGWLRIRPARFTRDCWVSAALTTPLDRGRPAEALLAVADHYLATPDGRDFTEFVEVDNLFAPGNTSWARNVDVAGSPVLSVRRAQVVDAALATLDRFSVRDRPLVQSFILSRGTTVQYFEPGATWHVARAHYQSLYERFSESPHGEELLWVAARQPRYDDCESSIDCRLGRPLDSVALYWSRYPNGRFLDEAVSIALGQLRGIRCAPGFTPPSSERLSALRATLEEVPPSRKQRLVELLEDLEAGCR